MPKYFFRLSSDMIPEEAEEFLGPEQVATEAPAIARDLAKNKPAAEIRSKAVIVTDEAGLEICRAPLDSAS